MAGNGPPSYVRTVFMYVLPMTQNLRRNGSTPGKRIVGKRGELSYEKTIG